MSDAAERYERLAEEFERDTGKMAPGKDAPPMFAHRQATRDEWEEWLADRDSEKEGEDGADSTRCD